MKLIKLLFVIILTCLGVFKLYASDKDSLWVKIEKNLDKDCFVNICFENNSNDTLMLLSRFKNFYLEWESSSGIRVNAYKKNNKVMINWGENPIRYFMYNNGYTIIPPKSTISLELDLRQLCSQNTDLRFDLDINYMYRNMKYPNMLPLVIRTTTNKISFDREK